MQHKSQRICKNCGEGICEALVSEVINPKRWVWEHCGTYAQLCLKTDNSTFAEVKYDKFEFDEDAAPTVSELS